MTVKLIVKNTDGSSAEFTDILNFSLKKEIFLPYTLLNARILCGEESFLNAAEILLNINGKTVHHGLVDSIKTVKKSGGNTAVITSRGFTSLLCQNQIEPGIKSNISVNSLMESFHPLPYVQHENNADTSNYIYVKNNSTMWQALANLSYKLCGTYPYIRGANTVRITPFGSPTSFTYGSDRLLSLGSELVLRRLVSDFHMSDAGGSYDSFNLSDSGVHARKIVRHQYSELDRQFLYEPMQALEYKNMLAHRAYKRCFCSYCGYSGEELSDLVSFGDVRSQRIARIEITGSHKGIFTELSIYSD